MACFSNIADETVDLVFADPPYNLVRNLKEFYRPVRS